MATPPSLIRAIREGNNAQTIKKLIQNKASANEVNYPRLLDVAVKEHKTEIVELLLEYIDYYIWETTDERDCPLHRAIQNKASGNRLAYFQRLLDVAVKENNVKIVQLLLETLCSDNDNHICKTTDGKGSLLHRAIAGECASFEVVRCILKHSNYKFQSYVSDSPELHLACKADRKDIVQLLIDYGDDVNNLDEYRAISEYSTEILDLLLHKGDGMFTYPNKKGPFISFAISSGALDTSKLLLRYMANQSSPTKHNWNAFSCAIFETNFNLVKELFETGHEIDLLCVYTALVCDNNEIFELIWKNVTPELVSNDLYFMKNVFDNLKGNGSIPQLWLLLNKEGVDLRLEGCRLAFYDLIVRAPEIFTEIGREERKELLHCFESRGLRLDAIDVKRMTSRVVSGSLNEELVQDIISILLPKISSVLNGFSIDGSNTETDQVHPDKMLRSQSSTGLNRLLQSIKSIGNLLYTPVWTIFDVMHRKIQNLKPRNNI